MMIRQAEELFDCSPVLFSVVVTGKKRKKKKHIHLVKFCHKSKYCV